MCGDVCTLAATGVLEDTKFTLGWFIVHLHHHCIVLWTFCIMSKPHGSNILQAITVQQQMDGASEPELL